MIKLFIKNLIIAAGAGISISAFCAEPEAAPSARTILNTKDPRDQDLDIKKFDQTKSMRDLIREFASDPALYDVMNKMNAEVNESEEQQRARWATGTFSASKSSDQRSQEVGSKLRETSEKRAAKMLINNLGVERYLKQGLEMKFDFTGSSPQAVRQDQGMSYGLVLKGVEPSAEKVLTAGPTGMTPEDLQNAPKSKVKWTIGPNPKENSKFEQVSVDEEKSDWPRAAFKGKISTQEGTEVTGPSDGGAGLPPLAMGVYQEDRFYRVEYRTKNDLKKDGLYHGVLVPIKGTLSFDQEVNASFKPTKTSAKGVLVQEGAPRLDLNYLNQEQRYQSDFRLCRDGYDLMLKANSASPVVNDGPRYEMGFSKDF